jgi:ankyrin repeat protein
VRLLLDHGSNMNVQCAKMCTPLHLASFNGHSDIAELLILHGVDVDVRNEDRKTPLHMASSNGKPDTARLLAKSGSNIDSKDKDAYTLLHIAALQGHLDMVKLLVQLGTDVNARNVDEETPLDLACRDGEADVASFLAEQMGVGEVCCVAGTGMTTLDTDSKNADPDIVNPSPSHGQDPAFVDNGRTSLLAASEEGNLDLVRSLLCHGADVKERGGFNNTPLHLASERGSLEVAKLLIKPWCGCGFPGQVGVDAVAHCVAIRTFGCHAAVT